MPQHRALLAAVVGVGITISASMSIAAGATGAALVHPCLPPMLVASVGRESTAAGRTFVTLLLKNATKGTSYFCALSGTPATQFGVWGSGSARVFKPVGPSATMLTIATRGKIFILKPGAVASVTVGIQTVDNYPPARCRRASATIVRLHFLSGAVLFYSVRAQVCTKVASTETSGVVLGTRFP